MRVLTEQSHNNTPTRAAHTTAANANEAGSCSRSLSVLPRVPSVRFLKSVCSEHAHAVEAGDELLLWHSLCEAISNHGSSGAVGELHLLACHSLPCEQVDDIDVLGALREDRILEQAESCLVVATNLYSRISADVEGGHELAQPQGLLGCASRRHKLSLGRRSSDSCLQLAAPGDGATVENKT